MGGKTRASARNSGDFSELTVSARRALAEANITSLGKRRVEPKSFAQLIPAASVQRMAAAGIELAFTIYGAAVVEAH